MKNLIKVVSYIGVAGVMSRAEAALLSLFAAKYVFGCQLMVGVLASSRTLRGESHRKLYRFPRREFMKDIFLPDYKTLNIVHYATDGHRPLSEELLEIFYVAGSWCDGLQLNMIWPSPRDVEVFVYEALPNAMVLQIGSRAFAEVNNSPSELAKRLGAYRGLITHVLLDPSGGEGKLLDSAVLRPYVQAIAELDWLVGIGVAGGLSAETLYRVQPLFEEFPFLSIDAESGLRTENDFLDPEKVERYIERFSALIKNI